MVRAEITFLAEDEGGRAYPPDLSEGTYLPHLVVERAVAQHRALEGPAQSGEYLGVRIVGGPRNLPAGDYVEVEMELLYYQLVPYAALQPGAIFTIREGRQIVGQGRVLVGYGQ